MYQTQKLTKKHTVFVGSGLRPTGFGPWISEQDSYKNKKFLRCLFHDLNFCVSSKINGEL